MVPFVEIIPRLSDSSLLDIQKEIAKLDSIKRIEPDWRQLTIVVERELAQRGIDFEPVSW
jgi:hypothetical protein